MSSDLEALRTEIEEYLNSQDLAVFHGYPRLVDPSNMIHWDVENYPDYKLFLEMPKRLGIPMLVFHHRKLTADFIEEALDQLDSVDLPDEEYVELQGRIRELRVFEGFTSAVEISFEHQGRVYFFTRRAEWYEELIDMADVIEEYAHQEEDFDELDEPEDDLGPYFSNN